MQLGHKCAADQAAKIGLDLYNGLRKRKNIEYNSGNSADIKLLRCNDQGDARSWLYLTSCLTKKIQRDQKINRQKSLRSHLEDPLIVWQILCWYFFGPPR